MTSPESSPQQQRAFARVALALCTGTMGTALASPLFPLYQQVWDLLPSQITYIFITYMLGVMACLLVLGKLTDTLGYPRVLRLALIVMLLGLLASAVAPNAWVLGASRILIGIACGLVTSSATVAMTLLEPSGDRVRAVRLYSVTCIFGFGAGPLLSGVLAQWLPWPLITPYVPSIVMCVVAWLGLAVLPKAAGNGQKVSLKPVFTMLEGDQRGVFWLASMGAFSAFSMFSLYAALAPSVVKEMLHWEGPIISGMILSVILLLSGAMPFVVKGFQPKQCYWSGVSCLALGMVLLAEFAFSQHLFGLMSSAVAIGLGHGLTLFASMTLLQQRCTDSNRAGVMSAYLCVAYIGTIVPILGVGWLADHFGLAVALLAYCAGMLLLCVALLWSVWRPFRGI